MFTVLKYAGALAIAAGWLGNDPFYMGRDLAVPILVMGIVCFANGLKGELVEALRSRPVGGDG